MRIGVVGTGLMGAPMARRLTECGFVVVAYNRTQEKAAALKDDGITIVEDITSLITLCDRIILTVTDYKAIHSIFFGENNSPALGNKFVIQMGTISPSQSRELNNKVQDAGGNYMEAPVLGSIPEAKSGKLLVMAGGKHEHFEQNLDIFKAYGEDPRHIGPVGSAAALKLSLNQLIGALTTAFSTSLEFGDRYGVPTDQFMEILRASALYAPTFDKKLQRIQDKNFANPNFPTKHLLKDMSLFAEAASEVNIQTTTSEAINQIINKAMTEYSDQDYSALSTGVTE